jgi:diguanylate cyclase (GGDEF)-like protein
VQYRTSDGMMEEILRMPEITSEQARASASLLAQVLTSDSVPVVPVVAAKVLASSRNPDVNFERLEEMISADPALVAKLLRMANSAYFGSRKKVTSINESIVRMGLKVTRMMVLGFSLEADISRKVPESFQIERFWRHALTTATGARLVTERVWPVKRDEAFSAGILQDIGMVALQCSIPELYAKVTEEQRKHPTASIECVEQRILGFSHARVGSELLKKWGIPEEVYGPVCYHHEPDGGRILGADRDTCRLAHVLGFCSKISHVFYGRGRRTVGAALIGEAQDQFNLTEDALNSILRKVACDVRQTCEIFSLDPRQIPSYEEVRLKAAQELSNLATELGGHARVLEVRVEEHADEMRQLKAEAEDLKRLAATDELTQLSNRRDLLRSLVAEISRARRYAHPIGFLMLDIDHFKEVNDTYGHLAGDKVLAALSVFLKQEVRTTDVPARLGGEEFVVLLPETDMAGTLATAEKLRLGIAEVSKSWVPEVPGITVSVGVVHVPFDSPNLDGSLIIDEADKCLYQAKNSGRNCTRYVSV